MKQTIIASLVSGLVVALAVFALQSFTGTTSTALGGQTRSSFATTGDLSASGTINIAGASTLTGAASLGSTLAVTGATTLATTTINGKVTLGSANCSTAVWNPGAISSTTVATTTIQMPSGFSATDSLLPSFSATTTGLGEASMVSLSAGLTGATSSYVLAQLSMNNNGNTSINPATGTLAVCFVSH